MRTSPDLEPELMMPAEVAAAFHVTPMTVTRWARSGKLPSIRTPGGHRRYIRAQVRALLEFPPVISNHDANTESKP